MRQISKTTLALFISATAGATAWLACAPDEPPVGDVADQDAQVSGDGPTGTDGQVTGGDASTLDSGPTCALGASGGTLDPTFSSSPKAVAGFAAPAGAVVDAQGRVYVTGIGTCSGAANPDIGVVRFDAKGNLDLSFNGGTSAVRCFDNGPNEEGYAIAIDGNGKILVGGLSGGTSNLYFASIIRFDDTGVVDPTFGKNGVVNLTVGAGAMPGGSSMITTFGLAVEPGTNRVVAAGANSNFNESAGFVARVGADGKLDTTFGTGGTFKDTTHAKSYYAAVTDATGAVWAVGAEPLANKPILVSLSNVGALVTGYGTSGFASIKAAGSSYSMTSTNDGGLVVFGPIAGDDSAGAAFAVDSTGNAASSFGGADAGVTYFPSSAVYDSFYFANVGATYCTGDLFVAERINTVPGFEDDAATQDTGLLHLSPSGVLDRTFGGGDAGYVRAFVGGGDIPTATVVDPVTHGIVVVVRDNAGKIGLYRFLP